MNRAVPTLPVNIEDAARSEAEIEDALKVSCHLFPELVIISISYFIHPVKFFNLQL